MKIENLDLTTIILITLITETIFVFMFRFTDFKIFGNWAGVNKWYNNFGWTGIIMDCLIIIIGFYIAKYIFIKLVKYRYISESKNNIINIAKYLGILLIVQIVHDILFYLCVVLPVKPRTNLVMDEFKEYANKAGIKAIIGDSSMYIVSIIIFVLLQNIDSELKIFLSVLCLYTLSYFLYQKPLVK